jgi:hypothetical protein
MYYVVHFFDEHEHLRRSERLDCRTDSDAIAEVARLEHPHVLELWRGERCVRRFEPASRLALAS